MSLSFISMIAFLLCNKYLCFPWFCSISMFCWFFFFFSGASASDILNHSLFLDFCLLLSLPVVFFFFCYIESGSSYYSYRPHAYFPPLVIPSLNQLCYCDYSCSFLFIFFACISFDQSCCCVFCPYSSYFSSFVSSSPHPPHGTDLKRKIKEQTSISSYLHLGDLCKNVLPKSLVLFSFVGSSVHKTFCLIFLKYVLRE